MRTPITIGCIVGELAKGNAGVIGGLCACTQKLSITPAKERTFVANDTTKQKKEKRQKLLFSVLGTGVEVQRLVESPTGADTTKKRAQTLLGRAINHYHICATAIK